MRTILMLLFMSAGALNAYTPTPTAVSTPQGVPSFASGVTAAYTEPTSGKKALGWVTGEKPAAQTFNWIHRTTYQNLMSIENKQQQQDVFAGSILYMLSNKVVSHWTAGDLGSVGWSGVAYSDQAHLFCALSKDAVDSVAVSYDGVTWTTHTLTSGGGQARNWSRMTYGNGVFCAVDRNEGAAQATGAMTSPDGVNWTMRAVQTPVAGVDTWRGVVWSPELSKFCAVAKSPDKGAMLSDTGATWTRYTAAELNEWRGVAWSKELGIFCAVAKTGTHRVMTSADGQTWVARTSAEQNSWEGIVWVSHLGIFYAVSSDGTHRAMTSADGITWAAVDSPDNSKSWWDITYSPEIKQMCAVSNNGPVATSTNGINWRTAYTPTILVGGLGGSWSAELMQFVVVGSGTATSR